MNEHSLHTLLHFHFIIFIWFTWQATYSSPFMENEKAWLIVTATYSKVKTKMHLVPGSIIIVYVTITFFVTLHLQPDTTL